MSSRRRYAITGLTEAQLREVNAALALAEATDLDRSDDARRVAVVQRARVQVWAAMRRQGVEP